MSFFSGLYAKNGSSGFANEITHVSQGSSTLAEQYKDDVRNVVYETALISLASKLAAADGKINSREIQAFPAVFGINDTENGKTGHNLLEVSGDCIAVEYYVDRIKSFFPDDPKTFRRIVAKMFGFAVSDGSINSEEIIFLKRLSDSFGLSREFFLQKLRLYMMPPSGTPYQILGVSKKATDEELKEVYYKAVRACHPDKLAFLEPSDDIVIIANTRINTLATAYHVIKKQRRSYRVAA